MALRPEKQNAYLYHSKTNCITVLVAYVGVLAYMGIKICIGLPNFIECNNDSCRNWIKEKYLF